MRGSNYSEYVTEFRNLSKKVRVSEAILVSWFMAGLPRNMKQIVASLRTNTRRDTIESASGIFVAEKQRLTKTWFGPREPTQNRTWEERNQIKQNEKSIANAQQKEQDELNATSPFLCYTCNKPGHLARNCWHRITKLNNNQKSINSIDYQEKTYNEYAKQNNNSKKLSLIRETDLSTITQETGNPITLLDDPRTYYKTKIKTTKDLLSTNGIVDTGATINAADIKLLPIGTCFKKLKNIIQAPGSEIKGTFDLNQKHRNRENAVFVDN
jgi:Zinc knuckle